MVKNIGFLKTTEGTVEILQLCGHGKVKRHCVDCGVPLPLYGTGRRSKRCLRCNGKKIKYGHGGQKNG